MIKNLLATTGDGGSTLGWEDPLEEEMATHVSILAWRIPWTGESGRVAKESASTLLRNDNRTILVRCLCFL